MNSNSAVEKATITPLVRVLSCLVGLFLVAVSLNIFKNPQDIRVAAEGCQYAPKGCAVQVTGETPTAFLIVLVLLGALFLLIGITGTLFKLSIPGGGSLEPAAMTVPEVPKDAKPVKPESGMGQGVIETEPTGLDYWKQLPSEVRAAAESLWFEWYPGTDVSASQALTVVKRQPGNESAPYYLTFQDPDGIERTMKVEVG